MTRAWTFRAAPVAMLLVAACQDTPATPIDWPAEAEGALSLLMPEVDRSMLVETSVVGDGSAEAAPARVLVPGEDPWTDPTISDPAPASAIWDARTRAGFQPGSAWAWGEHNYQGNKSSITTTVTVALDGMQIGSQSAYTLADMVFWLDLGVVKHIQAIARAYVHQECGLTAWGNSAHAAWWEAVPGATIATFGRTATTTMSDLARQAECAPEPPPSGGGGGGGDGEGGYCFVSIWYDPSNGEVIDWEILDCEPTQGG